MFLLQAPAALFHVKRPWWGAFVLCIFLLLSTGSYLALINTAPKSDGQITSFLQVWMLCFLPYAAACALVLATKPAVGRWRWVEIGLIFLGALVLRVMLLPLPPGLSRDAWRYLWDARVILHGYSPYVFAPGDKLLTPLRDTLIFGNSRFRDVPTIYPPAAELLYVVSYLLAPSNLFVLKAIFVAFDMLTCVALALLLARRGLDARRVIIYAWCPLPIVEFTIQGHVDVIAITFTILAVLCASGDRRRTRALAGILIGLGTLTKFYPILLLVVLLHRDSRRIEDQQPGQQQGPTPTVDDVFSSRRPLAGLLNQQDWVLVFSCLAIICLGYLPFLILGHGQVVGFLFTYTNEQGLNAGIVPLGVRWISAHLRVPLAATLLVEHLAELAALCAVSLVVFILRRQQRLSLEAAALLLIAVFLSVSSHVFPWYTTAFLPWIALLLRPLWSREGASGKAIAIVAAWYFTFASLLGYSFQYTLDWSIYYALVYGIVMAGLGLAALAGISKPSRRTRSGERAISPLRAWLRR